MKEDSEVFLMWLLKYDEVIIFWIRDLGFWSLMYLFKENLKSVNYYSVLLNLLRKIFFYIIFDEGFLGFFGFIIKNN